MPQSSAGWLELTFSVGIAWDPDGHPQWVHRFFETWMDVAPNLAPTLAGYGEPPRQKFRWDDLPGEVRRLGWDWHAKRPEGRIRAFAVRGGRRNHSGLDVTCRGDGELLPQVTAFADAVATLLHCDHGFLQALTRAEVVEAAAAHRPDLHLPWPDGRLDGAALIGSATKELAAGLPTLYWRNYFGAPYLDLVGRDLLDAPWATVEILAGDVVRADVTFDPPTESTYPRFAAARDNVMEALGRDLFAPHASRVPPSFHDFQAREPPELPPAAPPRA